MSIPTSTSRLLANHVPVFSGRGYRGKDSVGAGGPGVGLKTRWAGFRELAQNRTWPVGFPCPCSLPPPAPPPRPSCTFAALGLSLPDNLSLAPQLSGVLIG